jgi:hypothetical protein
MVRKFVDPQLPTKKKAEEYDRTHPPYRNRCPACRKAAGGDVDHSQIGWKDTTVSECCFDLSSRRGVRLQGERACMEGEAFWQ